MIPSKASAEDRTSPRESRWSGLKSESRTSSVIPSTAFKGVRISWLMFAKNSLFARFADSAASFASRNSFSPVFRQHAAAPHESPHQRVSRLSGGAGQSYEPLHPNESAPSTLPPPHASRA